jgi:CubicO group peptidase (beta-lactamase class C family)
MERCPGAWQPITIHHLLTHTSGIPNFTGFPDYTLTMAQASAMPDLLRRFSDKPLDFDTGTKYQYSNSGYVLLGHIIEKASGVSYEEYVRKNVFEPLGMKDTGYDRHATVLPKRAAGYEKRGEQVRNAAHIDMSIPHAAGALYSTVEDLYKWDRALLSDKLLPQEARERMYTPFKGDYAYGWSVRRQNGVQIISHGGGINGFATMIMRAPEKDLCVVALANVLPAEAGKVAADLLRLALGEDVAPPKARVEISVKAEILDRYAGEYELKPGLVLKVWREGERLMTQATGQPALQVFAEAENRFFAKVVEATLIFEADAEGRMTVTLEQGGGRMKATRK